MAGQKGDAGESKRRRRWLLRARRVLNVSRSARTSCSVLAACLLSFARAIAASSSYPTTRRKAPSFRPVRRLQRVDLVVV